MMTFIIHVIVCLFVCLVFLFCVFVCLVFLFCFVLFCMCVCLVFLFVCLFVWFDDI